MSERNKDRRDYLKIVAGVAAGLAAGGITGYSLRSPEKIVEQVITTVTETEKKSITTQPPITTESVIGEKELNLLQEASLTIDLNEAISLFQNDTGIKVNLTSVSASEAHKKAITDMLSGSDYHMYDTVGITIGLLSEYASAGYIRNMDYFVNPMLDKYPEGYNFDDWKYDGSFYCVPAEAIYWLFYWRTDIFEKAGFDPEKPPKTVDEFNEFAAQLTDNNVYGYVGNYDDDDLWANFRWLTIGFGGKFLDFEDGDPTKPIVVFGSDNKEAIRAIEWIKKGFDDKFVVPESINIASSGTKASIFQAGDAAMMWNFPYSYVWNDDIEKSKIIGKWKASIMPGTEKYASINTWSPQALGITTKTPHLSAAEEYCRYWLSPNIQDRIAESNSGMPCLRSSFDKYRDTSEVIKLMEESLQVGKMIPFFTNTKVDVELYRTFDPWCERALIGEIDIESALDGAAQACNAILARAYG